MLNLSRKRLQGYCCALTFLTFTLVLPAQQAVVGALSSADVHLTSHVRLTHTLGETATRRVSDQRTILSEGFQQGVWHVSNHPADRAGTWTAYPNPSGKWVRIDFDSEGLAISSVVLYNMNGIEILRHALQASGQYLDVSGLPPGAFLLEGIYADGTRSESIQLIKL